MQQSMNNDAVNVVLLEKLQVVEEENNPLPHTKNMSGNEAVDVASARGGSAGAAVDEQ